MTELFLPTQNKNSQKIDKKLKSSQAFAQKWQNSQGLSVVYEQNSAADVVSLQVGVRVGSAHEKGHESGICHLIEHMVFKGTKSYGPGEIAVLVEAAGGELNAYTSLDQTVYYITLPSSKFQLGMKILSEMVFDASFDALELQREKEVVVEEISRGKDSPMRVMGEVLFSNFYKKHPYKRPVIGTTKLVRGFSRQKVFGFYKKHYQPSKMIVGICGNVTEKQVKSAVQKHFKRSGVKSVPRLQIPQEPERKSYQVKLHSMDVQTTHFELGFSCPELTHPDTPALDVLSYLLGESGVSLLEKHTREEEQLVHSIYSSCFSPRYPGMFFIGGMLELKNVNPALKSIRKQIETAQSELFSDELLDRAKTIMQSQLIFEKETCEGTNRKWMTYETTIGDYNYDATYLENIHRLTPEDIRQAARKYLDLSKSFLVVLHPNGKKIKVDQKVFQKTKSEKKKSFRKKKSQYGVDFYELKNGVRVLLKENPRLPIASLKLTGLGGLRHESSRINGLGYLMSHVLTKGTKTRSYLELAELSEKLAVSASGYAGRNSWGGSLTFLREKRREAIDLFSDIILNASFDKAEVEKEKILQLQAIKNRDDNSAQSAFQLNLQTLMKPSPLAQTLLGHEKNVLSFTDDQVRKFYHSLRVPENMVISVVGDFASQEILELLESSFGGLKKKSFQNKKVDKPKLPKKRHVLFEERDRNQTHLVLGFLGPSIFHKDRYVLDVIHSILSGQGGRLFLDLRDQQSLAYSVSATMIESLDGGFFGTYIGTEPRKLQQALEGLIKHLQLLKDKAISSKELDRAKTYIIGNHEIDHQKNSSIAMQIALNELYGIPVRDFFDYGRHIEKVTAKDVLRVANKIFSFNHCVISAVGPKDFQPDLSFL